MSLLFLTQLRCLSLPTMLNIRNIKFNVKQISIPNSFSPLIHLLLCLPLTMLMLFVVISRQLPWSCCLFSQCLLLRCTFIFIYCKTIHSDYAFSIISDTKIYIKIVFCIDFQKLHETDSINDVYKRDFSSFHLPTFSQTSFCHGCQKQTLMNSSLHFIKVIKNPSITNMAKL